MTRHPLGPMDDFSVWLRAARSGSRVDLGRALEACRTYLLLLAESELGTTLQAKAGASDVVQDSFLDAHEGFTSFRGQSREEFLAWVGQILRNNVADLSRRYREAAARQIDREQPLEPFPSAVNQYEDSVAQPDVLAEQDEETDHLRRAIARMPSDYQKVITLRYHDQRSWEEVGDSLGKSAEAARKIWFRAVERLRVELNVENHEQTTTLDGNT